MKILITGGAGFIGSNLTKKLLAEGNKIICLDNLFSSRIENISEYTAHENYEFINHDIQIPFDIKADQIYNFACPASPIYYQKDPVYTMKTSILGSINVLNNARKYKAKVLQASTSEIYGSPQLHPQPESYWGNVNPIGPRSCYDEGKRAAESLFFDYKRKYDIEVKVVRIFNAYGPNLALNDGRVISNFIIQALMERDITVFGSGLQTRSFCYIDDLQDGLIKMMVNNISGPINLGNPEEISINKLAEKIINLTNSKSNIVHKKLPINDPPRRKPDISNAENILDWYPKITLNSGLEKTIKYFSELLNLKRCNYG